MTLIMKRTTTTISIESQSFLRLREFWATVKRDPYIKSASLFDNVNTIDLTEDFISDVTPSGSISGAAKLSADVWLVRLD